MTTGAVVVDLDGVVWRGDEPIGAAAVAIGRLRDGGRRVVFVTNNSFVSVRELVGKLARQNIETNEEEIVTSAQAAASLVAAGERALVFGGEGCCQALEHQGVIAIAGDGAVPGDGFDVVVVGLDPRFGYPGLAQAMAAIEDGARLVATNDDATYPSTPRALPGAGAILAAVERAGRTTAVVAGKPNRAAIELVERRFGSVDLVIGDRPSTDGVFARRLGAAYALVHTGVTPPRHGPIDPPPDLEGADIAAVVEAWVDEKG